MEQHLQEVVGELRGRQPPSELLLQRIYDICPLFRLTFEPGRPKRLITLPGHRADPAVPSYWHVWEIRPPTNRNQALREKLRIATGEHRLRRMLRWPDKRREMFRDRWFQGEAMRLGYWDVERFKEKPEHDKDNSILFGTDRFFDHLQRYFRAAVQQAEAFERGLDTETSEGVEDELEQNKEFGQFVNDVARDFYKQVAGTHQEGWGKAYEESGTDKGQHQQPPGGAGRERVGGPDEATPAGERPDSAGQPLQPAAG